MSHENIFYTYAYLDPRKQVATRIPETDIAFEHEPFYIGKGKGKRILTHMSDKRGKNSLKIEKIKRIMDAGYAPIIVKVKENLSEKEALFLEEKLISAIGTKWTIEGIKRGPLTNQTSGGEGRCLSDSLKNQISKRLMGVNNPMYGKPRTEDVKSKLREFRKTFRHSLETKEKMRETRSNGKSGNHKTWVIILPDNSKLKTDNLKSWCKQRGYSYNTIFNTLKRATPVKSGPSKGIMLLEDFPLKH